MQNHFLLVPMDHRFDESYLFVYSAFLLGVKANLFCIDGLYIERRIHMACLYFDLAI